MFDKVFGLPIPPIDAIAPTTVSNNATLLFFTIAALALCYGLWHWQKSGQPVYVLLLIGGGLTTLAEPLVDIMGACWHPNLGQGVAFELMGRYMPWWIVAVYFAFFGAQGSLIYWLLQRGVTMNGMRLIFLIPMVADVLIEETALPTGLYIYNGHQPLILLKSLPFWWAPCNSLGMICGVVAVHLLVPHLRRWQQLVTFPLLLPICDLIAYAAIGLPSFIVINTADMPNWMVQTGGVLTYVLAFVLLHVLSLLVASDSPLRRGSATPRSTAPAYAT